MRSGAGTPRLSNGTSRLQMRCVFLAARFTPYLACPRLRATSEGASGLFDDCAGGCLGIGGRLGTRACCCRAARAGIGTRRRRRPAAYRPAHSVARLPLQAGRGRPVPQTSARLEPGRSRQAPGPGARHRLLVDRRRRGLLSYGHLYRQARDLARGLAAGHGLRRGGQGHVGRGGARRRRPHEARGGGDQARPGRVAARHQ